MDSIHNTYIHLASDLLSLTTFGILYIIRSPNPGFGAVVYLLLILWIAVGPSSLMFSRTGASGQQTQSATPMLFVMG